MRANTGRPNDDACENIFAALYFNSSRKTSRSWTICAHFDSLSCEAVTRVLGKFRVDATENVSARFDYDQTDFFRANSAIALGNISEEQIVQFCNQFDAGITAAYDHECEKFAAQLIVTSVI